MFNKYSGHNSGARNRKERNHRTEEPTRHEDPALSRICREGMETKMQTRDLRTLRGEERVGRTGRVARPHAHDRVWHGQLCEPL